MDGYTYTSSYPDSGHSSPRSRDIDYENSLSSWDDPLNPSSPAYHKVKFMCSYGGKILPRPHDNQLSYVGGDTKIISVDRNIKFPALVAKLSTFGDYDCLLFKYQLPGEDLDALISVTNDEDLENLIQEYDRLYKLSPKPARLRLFLFGINPICAQPTPSNSSIGTRSFGSEDSVATKSEKERFVEALNSVAPPPPQPVLNPPEGKIDFLFGLEKGIAIAPHPHPPPPPPVVVPPPILEPGGGYPIQKHIQDLQRLSIEEQYRKKNENDVVVSGGFTVHGAGDYYFPNLHDNVSQMKVPVTVSMQPAGAGYWTEKHVPGGFPVTEPLYMIQTRQGVYDHHHPQMMRPVTGPPPTNQLGYYTLQNMPPAAQSAYPNQQLPINLPPISTTVAPIVVAPPPPPPPEIQPSVKATAYSEGYGSGEIRPPGSGGYTHVPVACDNNAIGKQGYYVAAHGGGVMAAPLPAQQAATQQYQQAIGASGVSGGEVKAFNHKAVKFVGKVTHGSV